MDIVGPTGDHALVYLLCSCCSTGGSYTFWYANDQFLGVSGKKSFSSALVPEGQYVFWTDGYRFDMEVSGGRMYYLDLGNLTHFDWGVASLAESDGTLATRVKGRPRRRGETVKDYLDTARYVVPTEKVLEVGSETAALYDELVWMDYDGYDGHQIRDPIQFAKTAARHVAQWPLVDLSPYTVLYIEDFTIAAGAAPKRRFENDFPEIATRMPDAIAWHLNTAAVFDVTRGPATNEKGALTLLVEITRYKKTVYFTSFNFHLWIRVVDAHSGDQIAAFVITRNINLNFQGPRDVEHTVAKELALYLQRCKDVKMSASIP